ncbi:toll/interleukin-1 receptor domain-containing protein [Plantactinospora sp. WMMB782]|uniref:toll/interleukin-1 receptor domain-containing protein n=1 Tax=Plantactinospora sp. WMMB782 TaxID=3404121 RepID=UPI003B95CD24
MTREDRWDFFIAYAAADRTAAEELYDLLSPAFRVFLDHRSLRPGDDWDDRLPAAQRGAAITLVLISGRTDRAYYQREEIAQAVELSRREDAAHRVVPILLDGAPGAAGLPYGLRLKQAVPVTAAGGLPQVAQRLGQTLRHRLALPPAELLRRYEERTVVERAVRLVPRDSFDPAGQLGLATRRYVFVGDHDEQRHRTLRQILGNLWIGDAFEQVDNSNGPWLALTFELGELNRRKMDLLPATWKAAFRILSDPTRAGCFEATDEERTLLGRPPRNYYSDDQQAWYSSCTTRERRYTPWGPDYFIREVLGISWLCFTGTGITQGARQSSGLPSRVFFVRNLPLHSIDYRVQDLGVPDDDIVLD